VAARIGAAAEVEPGDVTAATDVGRVVATPRSRRSRPGVKVLYDTTTKRPRRASTSAAAAMPAIRVARTRSPTGLDDR
jgi:hypothetical protein